MQTISAGKIQERLRILVNERKEHVAQSAYPTIEEHHEYITTDMEASFKHAEDANYYERLTGHIEEIKYLRLIIREV